MMMSIPRGLIVGVLVTACALLSAGTARAGSEKSGSLFDRLAENDRLIFDVAFNQCDLGPMHELIAEDFEFFHDQSGITRGKTVFIDSFRDGICAMDPAPRRGLVEGSLEVFPLRDGGELYGAIQMGVHRFYIQPEGEDERMTSEARFSHLWLLEGDDWVLARVLSYDHQVPD